jgi:hypothetical protein
VATKNIYSPEFTASRILFSGSAASNIRLTVSSSGDVNFVGDSLGTLFSLSDTLSGDVFSIGSFLSTPVFKVDASDVVTIGTNTAPAITVAGSSAIVSGSFYQNTTALNTKFVTGNYTLGSGDFVIIGSASFVAFSISLLTASLYTGRYFIIKNKGTPTVTVDATGRGQLDGSNTYILNQYESVSIISDGSNWNII